MQAVLLLIKRHHFWKFKAEFTREMENKSLLWFSGMLWEGRWFDSPVSACWSVPGQDTELQTAPDVLVGTLHGSHRHQCMKDIMYAKCLLNVTAYIYVT